HGFLKAPVEDSKPPGYGQACMSWHRALEFYRRSFAGIPATARETRRATVPRIYRAQCRRGSMKQSAVSFTVIALLLATIVFAGPASQARTSSDSGSAARADAVPLPSVTDFQFIKTGTTPPTEADCEAVG